MAERRVALFGGSFNPPHVGHTVITAYVAATAEVDEVWLMPVYEHAFAKRLVSFDHRVAMLDLATVGILAPGRAKVTKVERDLGGTSRTIDTLRHLGRQHPDTRFDVVIGADIFRDRDQWKAWDDLWASWRFIVIGRTGETVPEGVAASPPVIDVSSTEVRERLARGGDTSTLLPVRVREYIEAHGLYQAAEP